MLPLDLLSNNKTNFVPMGLYDLIQKQISVDVALMIFSCLTNNKHDENTDLVQNADMRLPITNHVRLFCYLFA